MSKLEPEFRELSEDDIGAILAIGQRQADLLDQLAVALGADDTDRALKLARQVCGLQEQVKQ